MWVNVFLRFAGFGPFVNLTVSDGLTLTLRLLSSARNDQNSVRASLLTGTCINFPCTSERGTGTNFADQVNITKNDDYGTFAVSLAQPTDMLELELSSAAQASRRVLIPAGLFADPKLGANPSRHVLPVDGGDGAVSMDILSVYPLAEPLASQLNPGKATPSFDYFTHKAFNKVFGHRGMGITFKNYLKKDDQGRPIVNPYIENTIPSFNAVAASGGDGIEFDVVLTRDLVPIIYHDFYVAIKGASPKGNHFVKVPIHELLYSDITKLQLYHTGVITAVETRPDLDPEMFRIPADIGCPTLEKMLQETDSSLAFNLEVKYPQLNITGEHECPGYHARNLVADKILAVMASFAIAGDRPIVISTFDFDTALTFATKQSMWPVAALTQGMTKKWAPFADQRCRTTESSAMFAKTSLIWGISAHAEDFVTDISSAGFVRDTAGVALMIWGDNVADPAVAAKLMPRGDNTKANIIITDNTPGVVKACK